MKEKRKKIWIDRFQTYLSLRIALYFLLYQAAVWAWVVIERSSYSALRDTWGEAAAFYCFVFAAAAVVFVGFLFIYDALAFAHRIVGPLYRLRKTIQAITAGEELDVVRLRKGDFLQELKDDLNEMLRALEQRGAVTLKAAETGQARKESLSV